mgnify:CR=1 FL=1
MAQHDQDIANQSAAAFRADLNNALAALFSNSSGASAPTVTVAYQWWVDTTNGQLKVRNAANNAWITVGTLGSSLLITGTNVSPNFGSQNIVTTGSLSVGDATFLMTLSGGSPVFQFDTNDYIGYDRTNNALNITIGAATSYSFQSAAFVATPAYSATSAAAANVVVSVSGQLVRSTSARKYKDAIQPLPVEESVEILSNLEPITYSSKSENDPAGRRYLGFIADDALPHDPRLVAVNEQGEPEGFAYERMTAHLLNYCRHLEQRLAAVEEEPVPSVSPELPMP